MGDMVLCSGSQPGNVPGRPIVEQAAPYATLWDVAMKAESGNFAGAELKQIHHLDTFPVCLSTYQPGSSLIEG